MDLRSTRGRAARRIQDAGVLAGMRLRFGCNFTFAAVEGDAVGVGHAGAAEDVQRGADGEVHFAAAEAGDVFEVGQRICAAA